MTESLPLHPLRTSGQPVERWADGAVVVPPAGPAPVALALNPTAWALWELCDGQTSVSEMIDAVCVLFEVAPGQARSDVEAALSEMALVGVIR